MGYEVTEAMKEAVTRFVECLWSGGGSVIVDREPVGRDFLPELIEQWARIEEESGVETPQDRAMARVCYELWQDLHHGKLSDIEEYWGGYEEADEFGLDFLAKARDQLLVEFEERSRGCYEDV